MENDEDLEALLLINSLGHNHCKKFNLEEIDRDMFYDLFRFTFDDFIEMKGLLTKCLPLESNFKNIKYFQHLRGAHSVLVH